MKTINQNELARKISKVLYNYGTPIMSNYLNMDLFRGRVKQTSANVWGKEVKIVDPDNPNIVLTGELRDYVCRMIVEDEFVQECANNSIYPTTIKSQIESKFEVSKKELLIRYMQDLDEIFNNNGTYMRVDTNKFPKYKANVEYRENECLTYDNLKQLINSKSNIDVVYISTKNAREIYKDISGREHLGCVLWGEDTYEMSIDGVYVYNSDTIQLNTVYMFNTDYISIQQLCDWRWLQDSTSLIARWNSVSQCFVANAVKYQLFVCTNPSEQYKVYFLG